MKQFIQELSEQPAYAKKIIETLTLSILLGHKHCYVHQDHIEQEQIEWLKDNDFTVEYDRPLSEYTIRWDDD